MCKTILYVNGSINVHVQFTFSETQKGESFPIYIIMKPCHCHETIYFLQKISEDFVIMKERFLPVVNFAMMILDFIFRHRELLRPFSEMGPNG